MNVCTFTQQKQKKKCMKLKHFSLIISLDHQWQGKVYNQTLHPQHIPVEASSYIFCNQTTIQLVLRKMKLHEELVVFEKKQRHTGCQSSIFLENQ